MKNSFHGLISSLDMAEERIFELEDNQQKLSNLKTRERVKKKWKRHFSCGTTKKIKWNPGTKRKRERNRRNIWNNNDWELYTLNTQFFVIQFGHSVVFNSLQLHGLQHARAPCPSPVPGACSNSCSSSWWCHPIISSSVVPFSSCLQSFPASGFF